MTTKKKAIIGVCVGAGVLLIGFLIYFFFIRFSIVGKWEKLKGDPDWLYIKNLEFQSNGDAFVYTTKGDMIKGHFSLTDDNKTLTIFFDKTEKGQRLFLDDWAKNDDGTVQLGSEKDRIQFTVEECSGSKMELRPEYIESGNTYPSPYSYNFNKV